MPWPEFTVWDFVPWATLFGVGCWVFRSLAGPEYAAGRRASATTGTLLALGMAVAGFLVLSAGLAWGTDRPGFTLLGWTGTAALLLGGVNLMRVLEGKKPWI